MKYDRNIKIEECQGVYPPSDDTFLLLSCLDVGEELDILEMGCGTGLISAHMAKAGSRVTAVDLNPKAVECTARNAERNGLKLRTILSDLFADVTGEYDLIVFNPPYLSVEEEGDLELAWSGGKSGVDSVRPFLSKAPSFLKPGGSILLLTSSEMDQTELNAILEPFDNELLGSRRYFFEELKVLRLKTRKKGV